MEEEPVKRSRRSTRFNGDFQTHFEDGGSSEEEKEIRQKKATGSASKTKRTKECPGCGAILALSVRECRLCDYQFTSKSMLVSTQSAAQESTQIRERFPFEPERDEDGSLLIQSILSRRPRMSGRRLVKSAGAVSNMTAMDAKYEYEYLIKYKNLSYLHIQWLSGSEIEAMNQKSKAALNRYLTRVDKGEPQEEDIEPSFTEIEKLLDYREEEVMEIVDDVAPHAAHAAAATANATIAAAASENKRRDEAAALTASLRSAQRHGSSGDTTALPNSASYDALHATAAAVQLDANGEEVQKSATQIFNPVERIKRVFEKIWEDPYSVSFQDPVDITVYDDYLDIVEEPMCLKDIKRKLDNGEYSKYNQFTKFAQDMRKIWRNCKAYNLYKSQIWHSAHALGMMFDRLYQAWVISYSDGSLPLSDPLARPWELSCRGCLDEGNDDEMMLCDHCDANHHIYCLRPPLSKVPEDAWMCPRCIQWFARTGTKVLSATAEEEARQLAEGANARKAVKTRQKKYLVKWRGLSYRECTWETAAAINDDTLIAEFHKIHDCPPDEPPLTQAEIGVELTKDRKNPLYPAGINSGRENPVMDADAQIYAQIRAYHFMRFNKTVPEALLRECGPSAYSFVLGGGDAMGVPKYVKESVDRVYNYIESEPMEVDEAGASDAGEEESKAQASSKQRQKESPAHGSPAPATPSRTIKSTKDIKDNSLCWYTHTSDVILNTVADKLAEMVYAVARDYDKAPLAVYPRPPLPDRYTVPSEFEVCVAKGHQSLLMRVGNVNNHTVVLSFKPLDMYGHRGPVERTGRVKPGDILVAIDGLYVHTLSYAKIMKLMRTTQPFVYLRFLRIPACKEAKSADFVNKYMSEKAPQRSSHRPFPHRSRYYGVYPTVVENTEDAPAASAEAWSAEYFINYEKVTIDTFATEIDAAIAYDQVISTLPDAARRVLNFVDNDITTPTAQAAVLAKQVDEERRVSAERAKLYTRKVNKNANNKLLSPGGSTPAATTTPVKASKHSSAAMETTDHTSPDADSVFDFHSYDSRDSVSDASALPSPEGSDSEAEEEVDPDIANYADDVDLSDNEKSASDNDNDEDEHNSESGSESWNSEDADWMPSSLKEGMYEPEGPTARLLRAVNETDFPPVRSDWNKYILELATGNHSAAIANIAANGSLIRGPGNMSKTRAINQIDLASGTILRVWESIAAAARTLNIPIHEINAVLAGRNDTGGGFKWEYVFSNGNTTVSSGNLANLSAGNNNIGGVVEEDDEDGYEDEAMEAKKEESWKQKLPTKSKEYRNGGTLRDYQIEGLSWLLRCWYQKRSSILADEMGLGKTVQVVTFLDHLFEVEGIKGPFLICVPLSTIGHWKREFEGWSHMVTCLYHDVGGGRDMRDVIREYEWYYKGRSRRLLKFHVLITTYDDLTRDYEELAEVPWRCVIVDEAHRLRNVNSKLLECMRSVVTKGQVAYGYQHRVLMTGTPLQNNTVELWSLMNFIEPAKFPDLEKFTARFGTITTQEQVEQLQRRIAPHLLRRVKEDVARDIPPKEETIIDVELTTMQKQYYRAIFEHNHGFLMQNLKHNMPKLMNIQMELRKCCNHPFLIAGVELTEMENLERKIEDTLTTTTNSAARAKLMFDQSEFERRRMEEILIPASGKMVLLDKLLPKLQKEGHKVLIFSQMVKMIDFIDEYCEFRKYNCERLDGRISGNERQKSIDRFNTDSNSFVFLLSTRAGGVGINLTAADTVIIFDSDWNPQNDIQAMARCHRIGQKKHVTIYRLITRRSFEAEMFERASKKLGLEQAVLGTRNFTEAEMDENNAKNVKMDAKEMEQLLREGAYAVLLEDDAEIIKEFYEADIDNLLKQRSHVLVTEGNSTGTESWLNKRKKAGRTSKSMFTGDSAKEHAEIDVNDPDFWRKVLPDLVTPDIMLERLSDDSLVDEEDPDNRDAVEKYMKDLAQMMEGMLDLSRRNQLPERERAVCLKLLLRLTLKDEVFDEYERLQAQEWLSIIEGTRSRRNRTELYNAPDHRAGGGRGRGRGRGRGGRGGRGGAGATPDGESAPKRTGRWGNRFGKGVIGDGSEKMETSSGRASTSKYAKNDNSDEEEVNSNSDDEFVSSSTSKRKSGGGRGGGRGGRGGGRGRGRGRGGGSNEDLASAASSAVKSTGKRRRASQYSDEDGEGAEGDAYLSDAGQDINSDNSDRETQSSGRGGRGRGRGGAGRGRGRGRGRGGRGQSTASQSTTAARSNGSEDEEEDHRDGGMDDDDASVGSGGSEEQAVRGRGGRGANKKANVSKKIRFSLNGAENEGNPVTVDPVQMMAAQLKNQILLAGGGSSNSVASSNTSLNNSSSAVPKRATASKTVVPKIVDSDEEDDEDEDDEEGSDDGDFLIEDPPEYTRAAAKASNGPKGGAGAKASSSKATKGKGKAHVGLSLEEEEEDFSDGEEMDEDAMGDYVMFGGDDDEEEDPYSTGA